MFPQLPPEYPFKPPHIMFLTPSGRFETNTKVCLSFSAFHPELWQPAWGIRLILEAMISFLPTPADGAIGALDWTQKERKRLAIASQSYSCHLCGKCSDLFPKIDPEKKKMESLFSKEIEELQRLQLLTEGNKDTASKVKEESREQKDQDKYDRVEKYSDLESEVSVEEEEIIFEFEPAEDNQDDCSSSVQSSPSNTRSEPETTASIEELTQPILEDDPTESAAAADHAAAATSDPFSFYDPLLNLTIVLLAAICYLLYSKFDALLEELKDLRAQNLLLE
jgi:ubiquitin-conjugating enzyme E2 J1